ncbi:putative non-specific serine/threonine protein kinase [Rosa chinensis]|uniref:Putative non-specific serine/threonine protein kinase n=1 Tax=Rosa chinensis TaxID=74649 RepID=A0A2P6QXW5_ROSCH|nr:phytosulfokine receptor 1 [Rosa chinensis]PRQ39014.1 putative non-specific serine/threonine protein kinase [Rosa chinensis]
MGVQEIFVVILVTGFCFQAQVSSFQNLTCNPNDCQALQDFMTGLSPVIDGWGNDFSSDCCKWPGITCNSSSSLGLNDSLDSYRVVKLELPSRRLVGNISESIGNLEQLRILNLSDNIFNDTLPISLFHLPNLDLLDLSSNFIFGPIPVVFDLPSIQSLDISDNNLNGPLSASICVNSHHLYVLNLAVNYFSGDLPPGLGNCSSLHHLHLYDNDLTGGISESLVRLQNLTHLSIQSNKLSGMLSEVGNLINLVHLDISINLFSRAIPDVFHGLGRLQYFVAHSNNFSGQIPLSLSNSPTISMLNVRNNSLSGPIDLNCSAMTSLASLDLGSNQFDGVIPSNLPSCRHLDSINLARNNLSGQIPETFKNFHTLHYLSLSNASHSNISSALHILQQCQNLTTLILTMNFYDEELPVDPTIQFAKLKVLIIANCRLTGSMPQWLSNSNMLQLLDLSWNHFEGTIPVWFGNFGSLFYLDISNNSLTGDIPRSLTELRSLIYWNICSVQEPSPEFPLFQKKNASERGLQHNKVSSFQPTLALDNNNLSGEIWPEFGNLKSLHVLDLKFNSLSGPILSSLSSMTNLETLDLSHNKLSGAIPHSLVNLCSLSKFSVAYNQLDREIPTGHQFGTFLNSSFEGNNLCGDPAPPCLSFSKPQPQPHSKSRVEYMGVVIGIAVGFVSGVACFIVTDRYVWTWHF